MEIFEQQIPVFLILDTNYWIYLAKGEHSEVFEKIIEKIREEKYQILTCDFAITEWDNGVNNTKEEIKKLIHEQSKGAREIAKFLDEVEKDTFLQILSKYKDTEDERIRIAEKRIETIEEMIKSKSIKAPVTDWVKDQVLLHGLHKKAPFGTKNGTADAIIFFSAIDFIKSNGFTDLNNSIFISYNHTDFSKNKEEKDIIHPDLKSYIDESNMTYERNIAKALKLAENMEVEIEKYMSIMIDDYIDRMLDDEAQYQLDLIRGK